MEQTPNTPKTSIFQCRSCKGNVEITKRQKKEPVENADKKPLVVQLKPAKDSHQDSKYVVQVDRKQIAFGSKGMSDLTIHKDDLRKQLYINRHQKREEQYWADEPENLKTASYWALNLLWNKHNIEDAIKDIEKRQNITIKYTPNTVQKHQRKLAKCVKKSGEDIDTL